jgi:hypothetical protein
MDNYTPISPQSPNVFRPRRSDDWHEYREIIEQLYRNDQLKLRDVKRIMERDYKFFASYYYPFSSCCSSSSAAAASSSSFRIRLRIHSI